jgi:hypothetical protein
MLIQTLQMPVVEMLEWKHQVGIQLVEIQLVVKQLTKEKQK